MQSTKTITLAFILFELFPLELYQSQIDVRSITWKPFKLSSSNFIWISTNIRRHAECKNHNSCFYIFWVTSLGTLSVTKSCPLYNLKTIQAIFTKLHINIIRRHAEHKNHKSCINTFWVIFLGTLSVTKSCPLYNLKTVQAVFMKLHININQH